MGVYIWNNLPSEYQEVEYIQSSGTNGSSGQYINTGIIPEPANTVVKLRTMPTSSSYSIYLCSCMVNKGTAQTNYYYGLSFTANRWHCGYGTADTTPGHPLVDFSYTWNWGNTIYDVEYRNDDLYVNNTLVANATTNVSNFQYPMFLFARNNGGTAGVFSSFKLYSCEIYKSGTLVRNFIPCYRKSDNVVGLYDLVNNQFYTNSGTGTFSKGSDVNTYRESSLKNAYIGEVYEYSYDFRNKSSTILSNDGWTVWSGTLGFTSNGIYASSGTVRMKKGGINLANANKLTMKLNGYFGTGEYGFRVAKITSSNQLSNYSGMYFNVGSQKSLSVNSSEFTQSGLTAGFYSPIVVFDFVNKTSKLSVNGYSDITHSLTDAEISAIKDNTDNIFIYLINNNSSSYISNINILIE